MNEPSNAQGENIDLDDKAAFESWVRKLNVTQQQLREAVGEVGPKASDVELHLKGVRSTTNDDRVEKAQGSDNPR
jgi:hypothetical protein